jgi:hypothetical protein
MLSHDNDYNEPTTSPTLTNNSPPDTEQHSHIPRRPPAFLKLARNEIPFSRTIHRDSCQACMKKGALGKSWEKGTTSSMAKQRKKWVSVLKSKSPTKVYMRGSDPYVAKPSFHSDSLRKSAGSSSVLWKPAYKIDQGRVEFLKVCDCIYTGSLLLLLLKRGLSRILRRRAFLALSDVLLNLLVQMYLLF